MVETTSPAKNKPSASGNVTVVCRFRPFNEKEKAMGTKTGAEFGANGALTINLKNDKNDRELAKQNYQFDHVFDLKSNQKEVYDKAAKPIIESVLEGFNGTIFAYGQTSSGKTHTMSGPDIRDIEM
jgi:kinesin family protein 5